MKKFIQLYFVAIALQFFINHAEADTLKEIQSKPYISVTGSAEIEIDPDIAQLNVAVESRNIKLDLARAQNDQRVNSLIKFLREQNIGEKDIASDQISLTPVYYENKQREKLDYYKIIKNIQIKVRDLTKLDLILSRLIVSDGINHIDSINFFNSDLKNIRKRARSLAAKAASEKADLLCQDLGVNRGKPLKIIDIEEDNPHIYNQGINRFAQNMELQVARQISDSGAPGSFIAGQIKVRASVAVDFSIE